jgi:hypothetical protein
MGIRFLPQYIRNVSAYYHGSYVILADTYAINFCHVHAFFLAIYGLDSFEQTLQL